MGDKSKGWILLYRSIRDSWVWDSKPFDQARAWIDLILDANHDEGKVFTGTNLIKVKRGQDLISIRSLASRWGWSKDRVSKFLSALQSDNMIRLEKVSGRTVLTIVNYGFFQNRPDTNKDTYRTPTRTRSGRKQGRNKEELKEAKEGKKEKSLPSEEEKATEDDDGYFESLEDDNDTAEH
jgi:DNA replication protein DnaD